MKLTGRSDWSQELRLYRAANCFISTVIVAPERMSEHAHTDRGG
jgi:hypothetical protein